MITALLYYEAVYCQTQIINGLLSSSSLRCLFSLWELSTVLKHQHRRRTVESTRSPSYSSISAASEDKMLVKPAMYFVNNKQCLWSNTVRATGPSSGARARDPGPGTGQRHRGDLNRWPASHFIIHHISQAYNRPSLERQAGKPCTRVRLQRSASEIGAAASQTINRDNRCED